MYRHIVFLQGEEFDEFSETWDRNMNHAYDYLHQWETGEGDITEDEPWGEWDDVHEFLDGYIMNVNWRLGYAGLCQRVSKEE